LNPLLLKGEIELKVLAKEIYILHKKSSNKSIMEFAKIDFQLKNIVCGTDRLFDALRRRSNSAHSGPQPFAHFY